MGVASRSFLIPVNILYFYDVGLGSRETYLGQYTMNWRDAALALAFKIYGPRCHLCFRDLEKKEATLVVRAGKWYLVHQECKKNVAN